MAFLKVKNRAASSLASGISDSDLSLTVATGEGALFPSTYPFHITIEDEILECTNRSTDVLTVTREAEGTTAAAHTSGKAVELRITAAIVTELQDGLFSPSKVEAWPLATQTISSAGGALPIMLDDEKVDALSEFSIVKKTGTATATTADHLIDTTENQFVAGDVGRYVWNTTDNTYAVITAYNSVSDVTLSVDIMANGEGYTLFATRFTVSADGYYLIKGGIRWAGAIVADKGYVAYFTKNIQTDFAGTQYSTVQLHSSTTGSLVILSVLPIPLVADDFIDFWGYAASPGTAININTGNLYQTHIYVTRLS